MNMFREIREKIGIFLVLIFLPLIGINFVNRPIIDYLEFPPLTRYIRHEPFSWPMFIGLALFLIVVMAPFVIRIILSRGAESVPLPEAKKKFPWWGWCGIGLAAVSWTLAWTRFSWFESLQVFTFTPIWLGYIIAINALTLKRTGKCMLKDRPGYFIGLFVISAIFWWYFEYLNRFVQNWYYEGIGSLSQLEYFLFATLPFSTVLPAVLGTYDLMHSIPRLSAGLDSFVRVPVKHPRILGWALFLISASSLTLIGIWPDYLFPMLWLSPLFIITSLQAIRGKHTIFSSIGYGYWRRIFLLAMAALVCGFFWELWNYKSLAKWIYSVPFVGEFKIFEMPILGYMGYLPFGLECAVVADLILSKKEGDVKEPDPASLTKPLHANISKYTNGIILTILALYFFIVPGFILVHDLRDPAIRGKGIPKVAWRVHKGITPKYAKWAKARVASGRAGSLNLYDVPSTEWPIFGSVYYLWATESLQKAWEQDNTLSKEAPAVYAKETIEACVDLILDPVHHTWVKQHWGDNYMHDQNAFFRSLIIAGLTSYEALIGDGKHIDLLRNQVETLSAELDASPKGLLDDYPHECYPIDILCTIACIKRADKVLGTDHSAFVARSLRAFEGDMLDKRGLIPYRADDQTGDQYGPSRGVGMSYILIFAHELWPDEAKKWYDQYEEHFWQERWTAAGFREFPKDLEGYEWTYDVDAGPIMGGFSPAANAFAVAGSKVSGRLDHAYTITAQTLAACWPLPNRTLLGPRFLSSAGHAPYLGEACILFFLTQQPAPGVEIRTGGFLAGFVWIHLLFYFGVGILIIVGVCLGIKKWLRNSNDIMIPYQTFQFAVWAGLLTLSVVFLSIKNFGIGFILLLIMQFLPKSIHYKQ